MCEGKDCRHGPSPTRKPFKFLLDPLKIKRFLAQHDIPYRLIAARAGIKSVAFVADVLAGRKRSVYVEQALMTLVQEKLKHS